MNGTLWSADGLFIFIARLSALCAVWYAVYVSKHIDFPRRDQTPARIIIALCVTAAVLWGYVYQAGLTTTRTFTKYGGITGAVLYVAVIITVALFVKQSRMRRRVIEPLAQEAHQRIQQEGPGDGADNTGS
jgi:hypothetical protein